MNDMKTTFIYWFCWRFGNRCCLLRNDFCSSRDVTTTTNLSLIWGSW